MWGGEGEKKGEENPSFPASAFSKAGLLPVSLELVVSKNRSVTFLLQR